MTLLRACGAAILLVSCAGAAPVAPLPPAFHGRPAAVAIAPTAEAAPSATQLPQPSPSAALPSLPAVSQGDIGAAGPVEVLAASAAGAWVALCQGTPRALSLVLGSGGGEPVDDLYAHDATGRHVIVRAPTGRALLIDTLTGTRVDLSALDADVRRTRSDYAVHRALSFSPDGQQLAYLRKQEQKSQVVLRQLAAGTERSFDAGPGEVFSLHFSADARFIRLAALREDTTHNGKLDWPTPEETASKRACPGSALPKFRSFGHQGRGDALTQAVLQLSDGSLRDVPELVTSLSASLLVREADGSLRLDQSGKRSPLSPASCAGRVLFADAERGLALVTCALPKKPGKRGVWLFGSGYAKDLQSELYETGTDREAVVAARLVPLYPGSEAALVDLERRELLPLATGSRVVSVSGDVALVWRGSDLYRYDARSKTESRLAQGVAKNPDLLLAGGTVLLSPFVIVDAFATALKSPSERALAISTTGHVLAGSPAASASGDAIQGPLHWLDARLPASDGRSH